MRPIIIDLGKSLAVHFLIEDKLNAKIIEYGADESEAEFLKQCMKRL